MRKTARSLNIIHLGYGYLFCQEIKKPARYQSIKLINNIRNQIAPNSHKQDVSHQHKHIPGCKFFNRQVVKKITVEQEAGKGSSGKFIDDSVLECEGAEDTEQQNCH